MNNTDKIIELDGGKATTYLGNYDDYKKKNKSSNIQQNVTNKILKVLKNI